MKRIVSLLVAVLLLTSLVACGGNVQTPSQNGGAGENGELQPPQQTGTAGDSGSQTPATDKVTVEPAVLLDEAGIKIQLKSLETDEWGAQELTVLIENNTDKNLTVDCQNTSVNGYMVDAFLSAEVAAGKKANETIEFMDSDLELCGVQTIADIEFSFNIYTTEGWNDYLESGVVQIKTSAAEGFQYTYDHPGTQVYNDNGVELIVKGLYEDEFMGCGFVVYAHNSTDEAVELLTRETSVNGFMVDAYCFQTILPGKHAVVVVNFADSDLEENDITEIEELETILVITEANSWKTIAETDVIKLTFA